MKVWKIVAIIVAVLVVIGLCIVGFLGFGAVALFDESNQKMEQRLTAYLAADVNRQNEMIAEDYNLMLQDMKLYARDDADEWEEIQYNPQARQLAIDTGRSWYAFRIKSSDKLYSRLAADQKRQIEQEADELSKRALKLAYVLGQDD